jgi:hypothetical protein
VLSGRGLCDELITRPEESYRLLCVVMCDLENLKNEEVMTRVGSQRHKKNPTGGMDVCRVLSGRGLCDELITRPEESCRLWCVVVCDLENLKNEAMTHVGSQNKKKKMLISFLLQSILCTLHEEAMLESRVKYEYHA